ncbi:TetR family transcriptional regulator [Williamsia sp. 1138]|jgi:AcrR family transcriptional regulator|uniref:TetR/AcrR family transcriptional regulator n=1 Tax=Gordonia rubripertincta TaxID=36822 RepID=A0ABT4N1B3_GORRU|nr:MULTISPECIES: TetR/AcrR family transcriptional regulator [Mycobacteriales]MCZ4553054.1 TetR/AcrR family transcriptional regulator [Gordonia rubripertincta]OZG27802.1 TetR family transcriptional regulator [Williamsia sp. 1138]
MRTHGWSGATPKSDDEAVDRILSAARTVVDERGDDFNIAEVARLLGVTRQTVYRYFSRADELLAATAIRAADDYLAELTEHLAGEVRPAQAVIEAVAYTLETLPRQPHLSVLLAPSQRGRYSAGITSDTARSFGQMMLSRLDIDWQAAGFDELALDELVEFVLRLIQSFVIDPGDPPRNASDLRRYLERWLGPALMNPPRER